MRVYSILLVCFVLLELPCVVPCALLQRVKYTIYSTFVGTPRVSRLTIVRLSCQAEWQGLPQCQTNHIAHYVCSFCSVATVRRESWYTTAVLCTYTHASSFAPKQQATNIVINTLHRINDNCSSDSLKTLSTIEYFFVATHFGFKKKHFKQALSHMHHSTDNTLWHSLIAILHKHTTITTLSQSIHSLS